MVRQLAETLAFVRSTDPTVFPPNKYDPSKIEQDSTSGPNAPDLEIYYTPLGFAPPRTGVVMPHEVNHFGMHAVLLRYVIYYDSCRDVVPSMCLIIRNSVCRPLSTGTIRLNTAHPLDKPLVDPK